jgi:tetraprenyl-beta-curcumene synthase
VAVAQADHPAAAERRARPAHVAGDRRLAARALVALALANARYWSTVAAQVRKQLRHWERRAQAIEDPELRALALCKLHTEGFNAEAAAMAATLAPGSRRKHVVEAIVALELLFDCLDGLTERPLADPLGEGERLFAPFLDAIDPSAEHAGNRQAQGVDGYLQELASAVRVAIAQLPAREAIAQVAQRCAARAAAAQIRMHASASIGTSALARWAESEAQDSGLQWREFLAGAASSVLALHALIAAAADPRTTRAEAEEIDAAYLSICVVVTLLDGLVDHGRDSDAGELGYIGFYDDPSLLAQALARAAREASRKSGELRNGAHHVMTLAGAIAYGASSPGARSELARPVLSRLRSELPPFVFPPLLLMRTWRAGKWAHARWRGSPADVDVTGVEPLRRTP